jgi:cell wall-associated NlpC family hydrolase
VFTANDLPIAATIKVCRVYVGLNFRTGPSTSYHILKVLAGGHKGTSLARKGEWYKWNVDGQVGWSHGYYLCLAGNEAPAPAPVAHETSSGTAGIDVSRDGIINACKAFLHFSYWWGGARFKVGSNDHGKCYSSTYSGHSGSYGADCSGYAGKVWQLPEAMPFDHNLHPFSTYHFYNQSNHWSHISRGDAQRADAMVYNSGGSGHIFIYESGDRWGQAWTYESRGCSVGVVHNIRTIYSEYRARHRSGV